MSKIVKLTLSDKEFREVMADRRSWQDKATYVKDLLLVAVRYQRSPKSDTSSTTTTTTLPSGAPLGVAATGKTGKLLESLEWGDGVCRDGMNWDALGRFFDNLYPDADLQTIIPRAWLKWGEQPPEKQKKSMASYVDNWIFNERVNGRRHKRTATTLPQDTAPPDAKPSTLPPPAVPSKAPELSAEERKALADKLRARREAMK